MKALITGGAGFIGYHLSNELLSRGYEVVLVDNFARGVKDKYLEELEKNPKATLISMDLLDIKSAMSLDDDYDYIYHLAAIIGVQNVLSRPYDVLHKNMVLLFNTIELARKQKTLRRFIFASTSEIYAGTLQYFDMEIPTPETTPLTITDLSHPRTSYMLSKIYGEAVVNQSGLPFTIVRPHNFYGPRMGMSHVIPELLKKSYYAKEGTGIEVFSVNHMRTFCYISDAVSIITALAESDRCVGEAFNIGNQSPEVTIGEVAEEVLLVVDRKIDMLEQPATAGSPTRRCPNVAKTVDFIGCKGNVNLHEGITRTFEWYKKNIFDGNEVSAK